MKLGLDSERVRMVGLWLGVGVRCGMRVQGVVTVRWWNTRERERGERWWRTIGRMGQSTIGRRDRVPNREGTIWRRD